MQSKLDSSNFVYNLHEKMSGNASMINIVTLQSHQ